MGRRLETVRAKIGATVLDVLRPGWAEEIDLAKLRMSSCQECVLGQLYGTYWKGAETLFVARSTGEDPASSRDEGAHAAAIEAGFHNEDPAGFLDYTQLTGAWKREIRKRLAGGAA